MSNRPDELMARESAGLAAAPEPARAWDPETGDGSLSQDPSRRAPLVLNNRSFSWITDTVCGYIEKGPGRWWMPTFGIVSLVAGLMPLMILYLITTGVGVWGLNNQVDWAWDITNFVFWIGIGHAGTLISAILCLLKQKWRTSINRAAEAMTIFAVICAGTFPGVHVGRVWMAWMLFPIPNSNSIWPNFSSPLLWDVFAVSTYATVSLLFWYMGMIPDFATLRDRAALRLYREGKTAVKLPFVGLPVDKVRAFAYGFLSLGWRFSSRHWWNYEKAYLMLAGVSTPLVLSVHSIVSFDFATSILPGWHTTIFPPYFVAGAIFGGFAMVLLLLIPSRELYPGMKDLITARHLENMAKILLLTGMMVGFAYSMEFFIAWYSGNQYEADVFIYNRVMPPFVAEWMGLERYAPYWWAYWTMIACNVLSPQVFWFKSMRRSVPVIFVVSVLITIGMWFERFVIIVTSLHRAFLPGEWHMFYPTPVDILTFVGSLGTFLTLYMLFMKFLPQFAMSEIKNVTPQADPHAHHAHHGHHADQDPHGSPSGTGWAAPAGVYREPGNVAKGGEA
ncbi:MAG TPA: NrfD/PsrC family molybdoenzyme membrane anchor subunit [Phycisphaerales bacterium]|nr:NrfD/PsrC family molybdoenzyme membrane anchor subunit [Phycisphaerales bacterium]